MEAVQPELRLLDQFVVMDLQVCEDHVLTFLIMTLQNVFGIDALESSHPISIPVKHPDEISEIFDRISYGKGASIIRMMDKFLTTETFRQGLTNYLNDLKYAAATQDDLWGHLSEQVSKCGQV